LYNPAGRSFLVTDVTIYCFFLARVIATLNTPLEASLSVDP